MFIVLKNHRWERDRGRERRKKGDKERSEREKRIGTEIGRQIDKQMRE